MTAHYELHDPFLNKTVKISDDIVNRLCGRYAIGPTMENGEPEFGWRQFGEPKPIELEAAEEIKRLRARIAYLNTRLSGYAK